MPKCRHVNTFFGKEKYGNGTVTANICHQITNVKLKIGAP